MRASTLGEVPKSTLKDKVNNKDQNIEKLVNFQSCRKLVLSEAGFAGRSYASEIGNSIPNFEHHAFYFIP
jgi:hypothetical protein